MGSLVFLAYPWGLILQILALVHFIRRRPEGYWIFVILFLGPLGAFIYLVIEAVPDLGLLRTSFEGFPRRKRIRMLEALVIENPSVGNYEELADLYLDEGMYARARECYDKAISSQDDLPDVFYRRAIAAIELGDFEGAVGDLERVVGQDPKYDRYRAVALLAHACANSGRTARAEELFEQAVEASTLTETYYNYAAFLAAEGRSSEARSWAERIQAKKATMPGYLRRRERPWFRKANALVKKLPTA